MNKFDLINAFSDVCNYVADNIHDLLLPNLNNDMVMVTPIFHEAHINDVDQWWGWNDHYSKYIMQIHCLEQDNPGSRDENIDAAISEIKENKRHYRQLRKLNDGSNEGMLEVIKFLPHVAQYADQFIECAGYRKLDSLTQRMDGVIIWPNVTHNPEALNLKEAFFLNVTVVSSDQKPLRPKIKQFNRFNA